MQGLLMARGNVVCAHILHCVLRLPIAIQMGLLLITRDLSACSLSQFIADISDDTCGVRFLGPVE